MSRVWELCGRIACLSVRPLSRYIERQITAYLVRLLSEVYRTSSDTHTRVSISGGSVENSTSQTALLTRMLADHLALMLDRLNQCQTELARAKASQPPASGP